LIKSNNIWRGRGEGLELHLLHPLCSCESRFGIKAFQHPDLVEILKEMTHETRLMALMEIIVIPDNGSWKGTLEELETALLEDFTYKRQIEKLLYYPTALLTYIRRLQKAMPEGVTSFKSNNKRGWELS
jgi:hypothetical protein